MSSSVNLVSLPPEGENKVTSEKGSVDLGSGKTSSQATAKHKKRNTGQRCSQFHEVLIISPAILLIIGLLLLPTVFYALPSQQVIYASKLS